MSKKENKKNANKTLKSLKRKKYARGGSPAFIPKPMPKSPAPYDDSGNPPKGAAGNSSNVVKPDVSDVFVAPNITQPTASSLAQQNPMSSGSVTRTGPTTATSEVQGEGNPDSPLYGTPRPIPANPAFPTDAETRELGRWNAANGFSATTGGGSASFATAPTDIKVTGPQANIRQADSVSIDSQEGITDRSAVQQLTDATDATSSTVTAEALTVEQGSASQAAESGVPEGFSRTPAKNKGYPQDMPSEGNIFVYNKETGARRQVENPDTKKRETYDAETAGSVGTTKAAKFDKQVTQAKAGGTDGQAEASEALKTKRDDAKETEAKGTAVKRDPNLVDKKYATAATDGVAEVVSGVEGPDVDTRTGVVIPQSKINEIK